MFSGGCIFVDHASGFIHVEFQTHLNTHETINAKDNFKLMCHDNGVVLVQYQLDNGSAFTSSGFTAKLKEFAQIIRFAGTGAHHHNGTAQRAIQTVMSMARTMMLHSAIHWPEMADQALWPMAVAHAVYIYNHVPLTESGVSPADLFTKTRWEQHKFHDLHVWGCPVYVLDKHLSDGKKIPHWKPRSKCTVYMGTSPMHASMVPLVLNHDSGAITAAFHVVFDDWFAMIPVPDGHSLSPELWSHLFGDSRYQYVFDDDDDDYDIVLNEDGQDILRQDFVATTIGHASPASPLPILPPAVTRADIPPTVAPSLTPLNVSPIGHSLSPTSKKCRLFSSESRSFAPRPMFSGSRFWHHADDPHRSTFDLGVRQYRGPTQSLRTKQYDTLRTVTSLSGRPIFFPPPVKIPVQPTLAHRSFKPSPPADPNIKLEGEMSSPRELCSTKTNSFTPTVASSNRSESLIPWREKDTVTNKFSKNTVSTKRKTTPKNITQGIQTRSSRILGTSQRVTRSSTSNLPPRAPQYGYDGTQGHGYVAVAPPAQLESNSLIQNHPYQDLSIFMQQAPTDILYHFEH